MVQKELVNLTPYQWIVLQYLAAIKVQGDSNMAAIDDLNTAVANLGTEVVQVLADIKQALANPNQDAAIASATDLVNQATANLQAGDPLNVPPVNPPVGG